MYFSFRMRVMISSIADFIGIEYEENSGLSRGMCGCGTGKVLWPPGTYDINYEGNLKKMVDGAESRSCLYDTEPA